MNLKEMADFLNVMQYDKSECDTLKIIKIAKNEGFVIVAGAKDNGLVFSGCIEYFHTYENHGASVYLDEKGVLVNKCDDIGCPYFKEIQKNAKYKIESVWLPHEKDGICEEMKWLIRANFTHESFDIMDGGDIFCRGLVFNLNTLDSNLMFYLKATENPRFYKRWDECGKN